MPRIPGPRWLAGSEHQCWFGLGSRRTAIIPAASHPAVSRVTNRDPIAWAAGYRHDSGRSEHPGDGVLVSTSPEDPIFHADEPEPI